MSEELSNEAAVEQHNEISTENDTEGHANPDVNLNGEEVEEFDIVLAGQEEPQHAPKPKATADHILTRVMRKKEKLQDKVVQLESQLQQAQGRPAPVQSTPPDEFEYDDRNKYLADLAIWQRSMLTDVVSQQLNQQQNGHRLAAQEQEDQQALQTYAENAAKLKLSDFNDAQDKAFDILGDQFAQLIARQLPEEGPKLMYWFSKNPTDAAKYRDNFNSNPGQATFALGKLAAQLTTKPRRSRAAAPEAKIESAGVGGAMGTWQKQYNEIMDKADKLGTSKTLNQIRELKRKAKADGYDVSTLK